MSRLEDRRDRFMKSGLLESQFQDLEEPDGGVTVNISSDPHVIVASVKQAWAYDSCQTLRWRILAATRSYPSSTP